ncbi:peptide-methionine (S)-S-oxide reductase MsrA [Culicoidibacter larvae]|uniref:Peptide methionine sulfoxide reductase MsrA n=1 Tax=Culicoidibacter larvae TaxID=2579976 RepID=A0A5R8QAF1_9FIRM|nr:peptide-methionine (S)-S-oxide reductase MsrA [Culicoidibacter larvae]TLG72571.1 peptide-methionine (S)-S-oxide reductase MsrA [Culicoidibacter larvae]
MEKIWFAGGCFWGVEAYFAQIKGVLDTTVGYAQGTVVNPSYEQVCMGTTGHAETTEVVYDPQIISLDDLLEQLFRIIDPTVLNRQGNDRGSQYRTGIYYTNEADAAVTHNFIAKVQANYDKPIVVEVEPLKNFYPAEEYHQDYLQKNPGGYCHINLNLVKADERK